MHSTQSYSLSVWTQPAIFRPFFNHMWWLMQNQRGVRNEVQRPKVVWMEGCTKDCISVTPCSWLSGQTWSRTFDCWYWLLYHFENLKTFWGLEREFQGAFSEPICSFLSFFVWEISNGKVKDCNLIFAVTSVFIDYCEIEHLCLCVYNF